MRSHRNNLVHTHKSHSFAAKIVEEKTTGNKRLVLNSPRYLQHSVNQMVPGDPVTVTLTNKRPKRTSAQNNYYWGVYLPLVSEQTGEHDLERLHELFKGMFLTKEIVEVMGHKVRITKSTTDLSVTDFSEYIMNIESLTGVEAPPTENYGLDPLMRPLTPVKKERTTV